MIIKNKYSFLLFFNILLLLLGSTHLVRAQVSVNINLSKENMYVQEPFRITITVYTTTWFTQPVTFGNLQIPNTFIIPFDKTQPGMFTINGKQYPGIQFYYIVFPYKAGKFTVPAFEIMAESPPEGSATGRKVVLNTVPHAFEVRDVPEKLKNMGAWFVAKNVTIHEYWTPKLENTKVGDVLKRTITIDAQGTLPQFIPTITNQVNAKWASTYPQDPVLVDTRGGGEANGKSTQTITYLLEKTGDFTIPEINLSYWNPYSNKINTKILPAEKIHIADNPNLGILTSLKDSLDATVKTTTTVLKKKGTPRIWGMPWYYFLGVVIIALILFYFLIRLCRKIIAKLTIRRKNYLASEAYKFHQLMSSGKDTTHFLNSLYTWWDSLKYRTSASVVAALSEAAENKKEIDAVQDYMTKAYTGSEVSNTEEVKQALKKYRKSRQHTNIREDTGINDEQKPWDSK